MLYERYSSDNVTEDDVRALRPDWEILNIGKWIFAILGLDAWFYINDHPELFD